MMTPVNVGVIGCGTISKIYFENLIAFPHLNVAACADLFVERAQAKAAEHNIPRAYGVEELLADSSIEVVVNLTTPDAHASVGLAAIRAGKSVYNEKPLAIALADARAMLDGARAAGLRVGGAPDTFLGGGLQTCRKLIDDGAIGEPVAATAFLLNHGPEGWHPNPGFYYQAGAGPMFDMGPYYLTALVMMLGPVRRVTGSARISTPERTIGSQPLAGQKITVSVPTHVAGVLDFAGGAVGTIITSFDSWGHNLPHIEIYGTQGTLSVPDPNNFGGLVRLRRAGEKEWREMPLTHGNIQNSRGLGVADLALALRSGRPHRANGDMACHVLEMMHAVHEASREGRHIPLTSTCERPAPLPAGLPDKTLD
ncbi:MAG: Gfo/Idh/MocA family oxidoreductase [Chloroflexi bacterium]|nr:Gfo/Idh/MocA family oxidoreductase [Chloroflexota bacterium]